MKEPNWIFLLKQVKNDLSSAGEVRAEHWPKPGQCPFPLCKKCSYPAEGSSPYLPFQNRGEKKISLVPGLLNKNMQSSGKEAGISFPAQQIISTLSQEA